MSKYPAPKTIQILNFVSVSTQNENQNQKMTFFYLGKNPMIFMYFLDFLEHAITTSFPPSVISHASSLHEM